MAFFNNPDNPEKGEIVDAKEKRQRFVQSGYENLFSSLTIIKNDSYSKNHAMTKR